MPTLARASPDKELARLIRLFLKAETDIINEIGRLRSRGLVDYHAVAALERVQAILRSLENDCWEYVPQMIEAQFYVHHPEARAVPDETVAKHRAAYLNAQSLTSTQTDIVQRLTMNLMGQLTDGNMTVMTTLQSALLGRVEPDIYRRVGLEQVAAQQAVGRGINQSVPAFVEALRREGVTAFVDKAGRKWSLHTYATMVSRSTSRQAEILSILMQDPDHDLYQISSHGTTCGLCAPYEGRVYSRSGKDPDFPPLSDAFGKMDPSGPSDLTNSWLNIHPNCLHALRAWTPAGRSPEELERIKQFSNPKTNPYSRDPRTQAQIDAYRAKEKGRAQWLREYRQWENYRTTLGDKVPKTFATFQKHKLAGDEKYSAWRAAYREANAASIHSVRGTGGDFTPKGEPIRKFLGTVNLNDSTVVEQLNESFCRQYASSPVENMLVITKSGEVHFMTDNNPRGVDCSYLGDKLKGSYNIHTHPPDSTQFTFSTDVDIPSFFEDGSAVMEAVDYKYRYRFERTKALEHLTFEQWDKVRSDVKDHAMQYMAERGMGFEDIEENELHTIIEETCKQLGVTGYSRWEVHK